MSAQQHDLPGLPIERTFSAVREALPPESVTAFEAGFRKAAGGTMTGFTAVDSFLSTWHGIVSRYAADPEDWALMHREAGEIAAGTRPKGPLLAEVLARRGGHQQVTA